MDTQNVKDRYYLMINFLLSRIEEVAHVEKILMDTCYNKHEVVDLIAYRDLIPVLDNSKVNSMITDFWRGPYERDNFLSSSSNLKIIKSAVRANERFFGYDPNEDSSKCWWKYLTQWRCKEDKETKAHFFQFKVWDRSMDTRYMVNAVVTIAIGFYLQYHSDKADDRVVKQSEYSVQYRALGAKLLTPTLPLAERAKTYAEFKAVEDLWTQEGDLMLEEFFGLTWIHLFLSAYLIQNIMQYVFAKLRSKSVRILIPELVLNTACTIISAYLLIMYYAYYRNMEVEDEKFRSLRIMNRVSHDEYMRFQMLFAILTSAQWARVFFIIRASKFLGPMIHIITNVFTQVGKFMIGIYLVLFLIFLSMGKIMFLQLHEFESTSKSIATLFSASLGEFDFAIFRQGMALEPRFGYVYMILFLGLTNIIALNFAIAILTHRFNELQKINTSLYLKQIIQIRQVLQKNSYYSSIVSACPPLNLLNIPLSFLVCTKKRQSLNTVILHIFYLPVLVLGCVLYFAA